MPAPSRHGFTLIELSLVLVIIGLIVGGILAGKALIQQAEIRATASQLQKLETAYRTFQVKYGCIAGDCPNATDFFGMNYIVVDVGCPPSGGAGNGNGNGDGLIDKSSGSILDGSWRCESRQAAKSLQLANFLPTPITAHCVTNIEYFKGINNSCAYFFKDDLYGESTAISKNAVTWGKESQNGWWGNAPALSPVQARLIDEKIDDGKPSTGRFRTMDASDGITYPTVVGSCHVAGMYNLNESHTCRALYYLE